MVEFEFQNTVPLNNSPFVDIEFEEIGNYTERFDKSVLVLLLDGSPYNQRALDLFQTSRISFDPRTISYPVFRSYLKGPRWPESLELDRDQLRNSPRPQTPSIYSFRRSRTPEFYRVGLIEFLWIELLNSLSND